MFLYIYMFSFIKSTDINTRFIPFPGMHVYNIIAWSQFDLDKHQNTQTTELMLFHLQINSQKEQITKMQSKLDNLTSVIAEMKARMDPLNKEVMERHVIGLCIEIVLILMLFVVFAKRNKNHNIPDTPRGSGHFMNGKGPPRLAIEDGHNKDSVFQSTGKFCQIL